MTTGGLLKNYEYGIYLDDIEIVRQISLDFNFILQNEKTGTITKSYLEIVKNILNKLPKTPAPKIPEVESPEEAFDIIEGSVESIRSSLSGWKLEVFNCVNLISKQVFTLNDINKFENHLKKIYPSNKHIKDKIRQQLQLLRDLGLIEFLGSGKYRKLWK